MKYIYLILGAAGVFFLGLVAFKGTSQTFQAAVSSATFSATGTTNATTTVNTTSTQVIAAGWSNFAQISNAGTSTVWCYLDNKTAASSSVAVGAGLNIGMVSSTFSGEDSVTFGPLGNIKYVGAINCIASQKVNVGIISN